MKLKYRFIKIFSLVIVLGYLMKFALQRHNDKRIDKVNIHIENSDYVHFITNEMIYDIVNQSSKNGKKVIKIKDIDISKTENNLNTIPFISNSNVYIDLNGSININIGQKIPVVRIKTPDEEFYLDQFGTKFPLSKNFSLPCLIVSGDVKVEEYKELVKLSQLITKDDILKNHIISIDKDKKNSYNLLLNVAGEYIEYGELKNNHQKLTNLKEFYKQYLDYVGFGVYKKISLKYDNQIVATKR
jgi:cell division protein FtsQ